MSNVRLQRIADTTSDGATVEPLALADAINYLKLNPGEDDALVADLITAARQQCEVLNNRSFIATQWRLTFGSFPAAGTWPGPLYNLGAAWPFGGYVDPVTWSIRLPRPPLISVDAIAYTDLSGVVRPIDPAGPTVAVTTGTPGYLAPAVGSPFPWARPGVASVSVDFTGGYGTDPAAVPRTVVQAIRLLVGADYFGGDMSGKMVDRARRLLDMTDWGGYGG